MYTCDKHSDHFDCYGDSIAVFYKQIFAIQLINVFAERALVLKCLNILPV